ncbi:MAG: radical SAM protein [archaeon]
MENKMKIVFIQSDPFTRVGIMSMSACLKKSGHKVDLFIASEEKNLIEQLKKIQPDLIGFSVIAGLERKEIDLAKKIKKEVKSLIIFGGPYVTFYPDEVINKDYVDIICLGEGEGAITELLNRLEKGEEIINIKNLWIKNNNKIFKNEIRNLIEDLDKLPIPDRTIYYKYEFLKNQLSKDFVFFRGCPYNCSFCFNSEFMKFYYGKGKYVRKKSVKKVIEEIKYVKEKFGLSSLMIYDDLFILDKKWLKNFLRIYKKEINLPFNCEVRADLIDEDIVKHLKEANCVTIALGVESGNEHIRNVLLNKNLSNDVIINACKIIKKYRIYLKTYNMVGIPEETLENALETIEFNIKLKPDFAWCSVLRIYPKTLIAEDAIKNGFLKKDFKLADFGNSYQLGKTPLKMKDINKIINLQRFFSLSVRFPFLLPLIKQIIKIPSNKFFDFISQINYSFFTLKTTKIGLKNFLILGMKLKKSLFKND